MTGIATAIASRKPVVTHWIVPAVECSFTASVWIASITIVESRIAAIPPTTSAISAFFTCGDSFASVVLLAALEHYRNSHPVDVPDTGTLRGDLLAALTGMGEARAAFFAIAAAAAFSGLLADTGLTPAQVRDRIMGDQRLSRVRTIYQRAHDRGEIDLERIPSAVLAMPFDLVRHDLLMDLEPLKPTRIRSIVDELFLPLVHNHHNGPGSA
nr:TetR-like C-terminal domain-containing protein [Microbispora sitophila]